MLYILFGKPGAGKSFIGNLLQNKYGFIHVDGDTFLTKEMKNAIKKEQPFTPSMRIQFNEVLTKTIHTLPYRDHNIVISQALFKSKRRMELLQLDNQFITFVLVTASDATREKRIRKRSDWISVDYARKICVYFEPPAKDENIIVLENDEKMPIEKEILLKLDFQPTISSSSSTRSTPFWQSEPEASAQGTAILALPPAADAS